jgi:hypothetical protein
MGRVRNSTPLKAAETTSSRIYKPCVRTPWRHNGTQVHPIPCGMSLSACVAFALQQMPEHAVSGIHLNVGCLAAWLQALRSNMQHIARTEFAHFRMYAMYVHIYVCIYVCLHVCMYVRTHAAHTRECM